MTVGEMLARMSAYEYAEWIALTNVEHEDRLRAEMEARVAANK